MSNSILDRYVRTDDGAIIIDVTTEKVEDLYNNFDHNAPFVKKDLDSSLVDYLAESASEIGKEPFIIRFRFRTPCDPEAHERVQASVESYFQYMQQLQGRKITRMQRRSSVYLLTGLVLLVLSILVNQQLASSESVVAKIFTEGLTIAAWVSLWEGLANLLLNWAPLIRLKNMHKRLSRARVVFE